MMTEMRLLWLRLLIFSLIALRVSSLFLLYLRGAPRIDLPLSRLFSLAISVLVSFFSRFSSLASETKIVLLEEAIWEELKCSYPKPVLSKANFLRFSISSSFAQEVLSKLSLNLKQLYFKLLGSFSQEVVLEPQCSNDLICFINPCG